jgi:hypothetical protein
MHRMRTVVATRYVAPLREGGSLPAIVEADDCGSYVLKFRGAGQGEKALVAELIVGELARYLGLPVPEIVLVEVDPLLARSEQDPEIQSLIRASLGVNLALDYLPGSIAFAPPLAPPPDARLASEIVWLDALATNVDRTARNTNLLIWHKQLYLIDHGASLYFHHSWTDYLARSLTPFPAVRDHVLLPLAAELPAADERLAARLTPEAIRQIVAQVPDAWLAAEPGFANPAEVRTAYERYLVQRLAAPRAFAEEAVRARAQLV